MDPKPTIAQKCPYVKDEKAGKFAWCACGESKNQPYCDGSHKAAGVFRSLKVELAEDQRVKWCGCKHTKNPPFCDGSHNTCG
jgi:CDGSH-type Zn-finger protein